MRKQWQALSLVLALGLGACGDQPTAPEGALDPGEATHQRFERGTGLVVDNVTSTPIPLLGDAVFDGELVITELALNAVGGLEATGNVVGTVTALGIPIDETFTADVAISRTGQGGRCGVLTLDLAPITVDAAGEIVQVDLTATDLDVRASGPVGALLCTLTRLLNTVAGNAVNALLGVINGLLGGGTPSVPPVG